MNISHLLAHTRDAVQGLSVTDSGSCVLFFSVSDSMSRAQTLSVRAKTFDQAWLDGAQKLHRLVTQAKLKAAWLRIDRVDELKMLDWQALKAMLGQSKRNYFPHGIAFDAACQTAMLEYELGANALLYDIREDNCSPNAANLKAYGRQRYNRELAWPAMDDTPVWIFSTRAVFSDGQSCVELESEGPFRGYRKLPQWGEEQVIERVKSATQYLADQIQPSGRYHYGWFPCFDKPIPTYNTLRHASSTYALLEGWELTGETSQRKAIERALDDLDRRLIHRTTLPDGTQAAFLVDTGNEIKLGGNAVCILAFVKYTELTDDRRYLPLLEQLALGVLHLQQQDGSFVHVLNHPDLSVKERQRIIYYDGEAAFGLMRLYGLTQDGRWLACVERAFEHFIAAKHWKAHDHWLSYCVNELTLYRPDERYYRFGLDNVRDHLDFVLQRITTYPTLLELMMAARQMIERMQSDPQRAALLRGFDLDKFHRALEFRARYLLNGHFWPELALFFKNPARIVGSFFIRHHSFRVRIDDVEHYLSGYVAYWKYLRQTKTRPAHPEPAKDVESNPAKNRPRVGETASSVRPEPAPSCDPKSDGEAARVLFLQENLRAVGNGIEVSGVGRARLFHRDLGIPADILTSNFNPGLQAHVENLKRSEKLPAACTVFNVYEWLTRMHASGLVGPLPAHPTDAPEDFISESAPMSTPHGALTRRSYRQSRTGPLLVEDFVIDGQHVVLRKTYASKPGHPARLATVRLHAIDDQPVDYPSEGDFVCAMMAVNLDRRNAWHFIVDKNKMYRRLRHSAVNRHIHHTLTAVLHNTHVLEDGRYKGSYRHLIQEPSCSDRIVSLTEEQFGDLTTEGVPAAKLLHIPHPIAAQQTEALDLLDPQGLRVIYLARYASEKRHHLLLDAFEEVVKQLPHAELHTYGVGALQDELAQRVHATPALAGQVHIHGYAEDVSSVYRQASLAVMSSKEEGFPLFGLECQAHGCPLVAFAVKYGPRDLLEGRNAGLLITPGDTKALARAVVELLRDPARRQSMRAAALESVRRFSHDRVADKWRDWHADMTRLLAERKSSSLAPNAALQPTAAAMVEGP
ncbi:glycosyltransferase involved in cell wall biosynthesis [Comamonas sp. BIGb0124]|nr:glycosyltransferase involved in cell wall biosynthesis [Comamonas sp. BIGb0124]